MNDLSEEQLDALAERIAEKILAKLSPAEISNPKPALPACEEDLQGESLNSWYMRVWNLEANERNPLWRKGIYPARAYALSKKGLMNIHNIGEIIADEIIRKRRVSDPK